MKKFILSACVIIGILAIYITIYNLTYNYTNNKEKLEVLSTTDSTATFYISEKSYAINMKNRVLKLTDSLENKGSFTNNGHSIAYNYYLQDSARANIVVSHGYTERKEKYKELAYYFLKMGYQVFILDHYSHGQSSRFIADSSMIYVDNYDLFTADLKQFITTIVEPRSKSLKTVIYAHSMGGGIAARTLEQNPTLADAIVLNAPMMKLKQLLPPDAIKDIIAKAMIGIGKGANYTLGHRAFDLSKDKVYNPTNPATLCKTRGAYWHNESLKLSKQPSNGASWRAISVFLKLGHDVVKKENVEKINVPILLFQAEKDSYVAPEGHYEFAKHAKNIEFYLIEGAAHEIYLESDSIIKPYYSIINSFIEKVIKTN